MAKITKGYISSKARIIKNILNARGIVSASDLEKSVGVTISLGDDVLEFVSKDHSEQVVRSTSYKFSYGAPGIGTPIEGAVNPTPNYSLMIVKCGSFIPGYSSFGSDQQGNILQVREMRNSGFAELMAALEELSVLK